MHEKTLAIMAAGLGSRYGGLKQLDTISDMGYSIVDYSIYDAQQSGFNHIVFIIREETYSAFRARFDALNSEALKISYAFQDINDVPKAFKSTERQKPWGTAHALYALRHQITSAFALINADDFYGRDAFIAMHDNLFNEKNNDTNFLIGYYLKNTLSPFGSVSRGTCFFDENDELTQIIERTKISASEGKIYYSENDKAVPIEENTLVSMNFWGFTPSIFRSIEQLFKTFLRENINDATKEFFIPTAINSLIQDHRISVKLIPTQSTWFGMTYSEDKIHTVAAIAALIAAGIYPKTLW